MAVRLSVIVPVYGTEKFLRTCLESLRTQSLREAEFLLVNDASPDGAAAIMMEYARRDKRFRVLNHETNRGLFASRLTGADAATGEYLAFLDSDDYVSCDFYRAAIRAAEDIGADLVMGDTVWVDARGRKLVRTVHQDCVMEENLAGEDIRRAFFGQAMTCYSWHTIWNKVIRRDLWDKCAPWYRRMTGHIVMTEDIAFSSVLFAEAGRFHRHHGDGVFYCEHPASSTGSAATDHQKFFKNYGDIAEVFAFVDSYLAQKGLTRERQDLSRGRKWYARMWRQTCQTQAVSPPDQARAAEITRRLCPEGVEENTDDREIWWYDAPTILWQSGTEEIKRAILGLEGDQPRVVSFDVFDTLMQRPFREPSDLFRLLESKWQFNHRRSLTSFQDARIQAEKAARSWRSAGKADVSLWDIYSALRLGTGASEECVAAMVYEEREAEIRFCLPRKTGVQLFQLAKAAGLRVVLTSDMYLDRRTMERMLTKCGVTGYETLFLSNEDNGLKWDGGLYQVLLGRLGVDAGSVLHIGDHWNNDVLAPKKLGIRAMHLPRSVDVMRKAEYTKLGEVGRNVFAGFAAPEATEPLALRCAQAMAANRFFDGGSALADPNTAFGLFPSRIGYYAVGTHLLALAQWLIRRAKADGVKRLVFLARDGALAKKAVDLLKTEDDALETDYVPASRRCLMPALMANSADMLALPINPVSYTPRKLLALLDFCTFRENAEERCEQADFALDAPFGDHLRYEAFIRWYYNALYDGCAHQRAYSLAREYYEAKLPEGSACFDMGYSGRLQAALSQLTGRGVPVYFVHDDAKECPRLAEAYGFRASCFYPMKPGMSGAFREFLLSSDEAPCVGFARVDGQPAPVYGKREYGASAQFLIECIQHHALAFVKEFRDTFSGTCVMEAPGLAMSQPFEGLLRYLPDRDLDLFRDISFEDTVYAGRDDLDLAGLIRVQAQQANQAFVEGGAPMGRMVGFIPEQTGLMKRTIGFLLFDRNLFREKLKKRINRYPKLAGFLRKLKRR